MLPGSAYALNLLQAYTAALQNDPVFAAAGETYQAAIEALPQARAGLLPSVDLTASRGFNHYRQPGLSSNDDNRQYGVVASQPLFNQANRQAYQQSQWSVQLAEQVLRQARQALILRVAQAYFDVLVAETALRFSNAQQTAITEQLAAAKRNFDVGTATVTDTYEAQARFDLSNAQLLGAQTTLTLKQNVLSAIIGETAARDLSSLPETVDSHTLQHLAGFDRSVNDWLDLQAGNLTLQQAEISLQIAKLEATRNKAERYPVVALSAGLNRSKGDIDVNGFGLDGLPTTARNVQLSFNMPLYAGGAINSRVRQSLALKRRAEQDLEQARRDAILNIRSAYLGLHNNLAQATALEAAQASSLSALEANKVGYDLGVRINIDVLNAQQQLFQTRSDLARARYDVLLADLQLAAALGDLSAERLQAVNNLLGAAGSDYRRP